MIHARRFDAKSCKTFLEKLRAILETPELNSIISWSLDGTQIEIKQTKNFEDDVLPRFFSTPTLEFICETTQPLQF
jgi:hypothetical protein